MTLHYSNDMISPSMKIRRRGPIARGFTLIEVLVVIVIIGVFASITTLSIEGLRSRSSDDEVARLRQVLEIAGERASVHGSPLSVEFLANGYRFSTLDAGGQWRLLFSPATLAEREWPQDMTVESLEINGQRVAPPYKIIFASESPEFVLRLRTSQGGRMLVGHMSGAITQETPAQDAPMAAKG
ncbi:MAG TPA: prepilin-type N-terminal cleavage/methylation domain-containing protein [Rhodocyclaceae bacterium]|nr:prepilin-type N-terminal cleavage/methylation domain-containing protein [Rhodocyclaceae bacterium]